MIVKHISNHNNRTLFEKAVQSEINKVLNELGCNRKLVDIKYSAVINEKDTEMVYSALLIFS